MSEHVLPVAGPSRLRDDLLRIVIAVGFVLGVVVLTWSAYGTVSLTLVVAASFGAYMAMNIGANDVANNVGPAVGAQAMTMTTAIVIAAVFEAMGAILAGGEVVGTIKNGIIDPARVSDPSTFVWLMMAALLAAALWLNIATWMGAPVSTTHSIVGGVLGAGVAAAGWGVANWGTVGQIVASWVVSPLMGGLIAAGFLYAVKRGIAYQSDVIAAARRVVPILLGLMGWLFAAYLLIKGVNKLVKLDIWVALGVSAACGVMVMLYTQRWVARRVIGLPQDRTGVNRLFTVPLICAAALLSFAHGSNDVANAIGPLAAIYDTLTTASIGTAAAVPLWIMLIGALGLSVGLALYGPRLIRTVGSEITEIDPMRAYCIVMSAALTVLVASQLGLPISTTHVAIGAVFGVGFLREYLKTSYARVIEEIELHHREQNASPAEVEAYLDRFEAASRDEKGRMLKALKREVKAGQSALSKAERKHLNKVYRKDLVKRSLVIKMIAAWIITVPASAGMAAMLYFTIRGVMLR